MKVCIITTPIRPIPTQFPPMGSMFIIQSLREDGHDVDFFHIDYHRYTHQQILDYFKNHKYDAVGVSAVVSTAYAYTKYITDLIYDSNPECTIFLGGGLAASSNVLLEKTKVKYCIIGDGELISKNLIKSIEQNKTSDEDIKQIKGITFRDSKGEIIFTGYGEPLTAENLLLPDYTILEKDGSIDHYIAEQAVHRFHPDREQETKTKSAFVLTSKGCVARCTFCHRFEKGYRVMPVQKIINYMLFLRKEYGVNFIYVGDENFGSYKDSTKDLVALMGKNGFKWSAAGVRAHTVDYEMLKFWKDNGCESILYGIESGSHKMLQVMEKKITREANLKAIKATYEAGLPTIIQYVIGMPGETDQTIEESYDFLKKSIKYYPDNFRDQYDFVTSINYAQALPGTPLYEYAREEGYIGKSTDEEEQYLLNISDKDAYDVEHFINYTQQPLLKVYSWRHLIKWKIWRDHAKINLKINLSKFTIIVGLLSMLLKKIYPFKYNSKLEEILYKFRFKRKQEKSAFINFGNKVRTIEALRLLLPWNKFTYPFLCTIIAIHEAKSFKWTIKLIFEHLVWSFKKPPDLSKLPSITLRKTVNITDKDFTLELRKGR
jgi:anaerobic magnesium-protoporphyrin IX monomethyl ester cyclase